MKKNLISLILFLSISIYCHGKEYHVAVSGSDINKGSVSEPFRTISKAAIVAQPGDTITVHKGIYREWVNPLFGGFNNKDRITYRAAEGEEVTIKGSEVIKTWEEVGDEVWKVIIDNSFFGDYNPYNVFLGGDWYHKGKMDLHVGEVFLNEKSLYEVDSVEKLRNESLVNANDNFSVYKWYCEVNDEHTIIRVAFQAIDPNKELVEINVRQACFFPKNTGINYITVQGFKMSQAATQWAPPTAEQPGLIGPNWSKGWIIENNIISNSKCTGISLGKERSTGQNEWTRLKAKHGAQREREVIFRALEIGWSKENIGSHIVRDNVIFDCEQAGICGHLGAIYSKIYNNHIYDIHTKDQFDGFEIAGIKIHAGIDMLIKNNLVHNTDRGIWIDWQGQGLRLSENVMFDNSKVDLFIEVCHGPHIIDNNIMLSKKSFLNVSQGGAYIHNLFFGEIRLRPVHDRFTPYHYPHSTAVAGLMTTQGGDDRFYNNIFFKPENVLKSNKSGEIGYGLNVFDPYPINSDNWITGYNVNDYLEHKFPVSISNNLYINGAIPFNREENAVSDSSGRYEISIEEKSDGFYLTMKIGESYKKVNTQIITSKDLGVTLQTETIFDDFDGSEITFDTDFFNTKRNTTPKPGPFEDLKDDYTIKVWPKLESNN